VLATSGRRGNWVPPLTSSVSRLTATPCSSAPGNASRSDVMTRFCRQRRSGDRSPKGYAQAALPGAGRPDPVPLAVAAVATVERRPGGARAHHRRLSDLAPRRGGWIRDHLSRTDSGGHWKVTQLGRMVPTPGRCSVTGRRNVRGLPALDLLQLLGGLLFLQRLALLLRVGLPR
jgi:hypothetical protein